MFALICKELLQINENKLISNKEKVKGNVQFTCKNNSQQTDEKHSKVKEMHFLKSHMWLFTSN